MIFVTDKSGLLIHISRDWSKLTGQKAAAALGLGFLECIHPADRAIVCATRDRARETASEYSVRCRLRRAEGGYRWVGSGGVPSFGMDDSKFIGYLGTVTEIADGATDTIAAYGNVERFAPPPPHPTTLPSCDLDMIADYLILAHSLVEKSGVVNILPDLRSALFKVGHELAGRTRSQSRKLN